MQTVDARHQGRPRPYTYSVPYIRHFWRGHHKKYGHIRCIYTVLANPNLHTHISNRRIYCGLCTCAPMRVYTSNNTRTHTRTHMHTHTYTHTHTHTRAHTHTHTHTHIIIRCLGQRNMQLLQIRTHPLIWLGVVITPPPSTTQAYMHAT